MTPALATAKAYPIMEYLAEKGYAPHSKRGHQLYYLSPLKAENTPSFCVHPEKNVFYCFASGERGDVLKLVQLIENCSFSEAVSRLNQTPAMQPTVLPAISLSSTDKNSGLIIRKIKPLENRALLQYLESRGINPQLVRFVPQLQEAYYDYGTQRRFALAFANDKGGYELRNGVGGQGKGFKGGIGKKWFTTVHGTEGKECILFEGFIDFLSFLQYRKTHRLKTDAIVLNSCIMAEKVIPELTRYSRIFLLLDNDRAGDQATELLMKAHPQPSDSRKILGTHKDVNEWLQATFRKRHA